MKILKNKTIKKLTITLIACTTIANSTLPVYAATSKINSWHLVDSGKHLDWDGSTKYQSQFDTSVTTWNNYKSGVIRKDSGLVIEDVKISDYSEVSNSAATTSSDGKIKFNTYNMDNLSVNDKKNVCLHELGHALGLAHNAEGDVMYNTVAGTTSLSENDKASYDESYKRY